MVVRLRLGLKPDTAFCFELRHGIILLESWQKDMSIINRGLLLASLHIIERRCCQ